MKKQRNKPKGFRTFAGTKSNSALEPNIFLLICVLCGLVGGKLSVNSSSTEEYERAIINIEYVSETNSNTEKPPKTPEKLTQTEPKPPINPLPQIEPSKPPTPPEPRPFTGFDMTNPQQKPSRPSGGSPVSAFSTDFDFKNVDPDDKTLLLHTQEGPKVFSGIGSSDTIGIAEVPPSPDFAKVIPRIIPDSSQKTGTWIPLRMGENVAKWDREKQVAGREFNEILSFFFNKIEGLKAIQETRVSYHGKIKTESRPFTLIIYDYDGLDYQLHIPQRSSDKVHFSVRESKPDPDKKINSVRQGF